MIKIELRQSKESGREPDFIDESGFPWWDNDLVAPADPSAETGVCPQCGSDTWNGWCTYAGADHS